MGTSFKLARADLLQKSFRNVKTGKGKAALVLSWEVRCWGSSPCSKWGKRGTSASCWVPQACVQLYSGDTPLHLLFSCRARSQGYVQRVPTTQDGCHCTPGKGIHHQLLQSSACRHEIGNLDMWGTEKSQRLDCGYGRHLRFKFQTQAPRKWKNDFLSQIHLMGSLLVTNGVIVIKNVTKLLWSHCLVEERWMNAGWFYAFLPVKLKQPIMSSFCFLYQ